MTNITTFRVNGRIKAIWPNGVDTNASPLVNRAWKAIDPEALSSSTGLMSRFTAQRDKVNDDRELSNEGKRNRIKQAASNALSNLKSTAEAVLKMEAEYRENTGVMVKIPEQTPADAVIDLEIARMYRENPPVATLVSMNWSDRAKQALVRLPKELTGMDEKTFETVRMSLADPATAAAYADDAAAIATARNAVQGAIDSLQADAQEPISELVRMFGKGWKIPGSTETMTQVMADRQAAEQAAE